jgi:rare lipoprotein A
VAGNALIPRAAAALMLALLGACAFTPRPHTAPPLPTPIPDIANIPDAEPRAELRSARGNPDSYVVLGKRYSILGSAEGFVERGVASWYGADFHGKNTSTGEPYDMYAMTAAHKTLPIPCYARITNLRNGRSVIVRINDRGPFVANRIVDLSYTAAARLDMIREGTAFVELQVLTPGTAPSLVGVPAPTSVPAAPALVAEPPAPAAHTQPQTWAQVGAYADAGNAQRVLRRLEAAGLAGVSSTERVKGIDVTRVRIGPIDSVAGFDALQERLRALGLGEARLVTD